MFEFDIYSLLNVHSVLAMSRTEKEDADKCGHYSSRSSALADLRATLSEIPKNRATLTNLRTV